jgi:hypothetical protein
MPVHSPAYHFAVIVPDLAAAQAELTAALGVRWAAEQRRATRVEDGTEIDVRFVYSVTGPPHLELIEQRAGTLFGTPGLHHIGVFTDEPHAASAELEALGWPRESVAIDAEGQWAGALFHQGTAGLRVEVVDIATSGPRFVRYLAGGDYA